MKKRSQKFLFNCTVRPRKQFHTVSAAMPNIQLPISVCVNGTTKRVTKDDLSDCLCCNGCWNGKQLGAEVTNWQ